MKNKSYIVFDTDDIAEALSEQDQLSLQNIYTVLSVHRVKKGKNFIEGVFIEKECTQFPLIMSLLTKYPSKQSLDS